MSQTVKAEKFGLDRNRLGRHEIDRCRGSDTVVSDTCGMDVSRRHVCQSQDRFERILDRKRGKISSFQLGNVASCTTAMLENPQPITRSNPQLWSDTAAVWSFFPHSALCGGCENNLLHICRMCSLQSGREEHPEALKDAHHQYGAPSVAATVGKKLQISAQK